jgi:peptidoglycan/xylan/chitin deacetylase (PgdA/CDA1 family)
VGCHTHSHRRLATYASAGELAADCARSRAILSEVLGAPVEHFSFPYGEYSLAAKRRLAHDYATLRLTQGGVNRGRTDLTMLRAEQIYSRSLDREHLAALIDDCGRAGGWLILYTHGVVDEPDDFGVTPQDLRWAVERCAAHGELLTVGDALARVA